MSAYERLIETCHDLAAGKYGHGAAISVDREGSGFLCRVWNAKGSLVLKGPENARNKAEAFRSLKKVLEKKPEFKAPAGVTKESPCACGHILDEHSETGECQGQARDEDGQPVDDYCPCAFFALDEVAS